MLNSSDERGAHCWSFYLGEEVDVWLSGIENVGWTDGGEKRDDG